MHVDTPHSAPRRALTSLPVELLTRIALLLDRPTSLNLARVARSLTFSADNRIGREIDLFLPTHYGELPLQQPHDRYHRDHAEWAKTEAAKAEDRRRAGLKAKALQIAKQGSERRLGMVEKVHIVPRPDALHAILGFLELVAPNLRELVVDPPAPHVLAAGWRPSNFDTLDTKILDYRLDFPSLTHLTITRDSIRFPEFITLLFRAAPNITHANIDVQHALEVPKWDGSGIPKYPGQYGELETTKLRKLRLLFADRTDGGAATHNPVVKLVHLSPLLEQVSLKFNAENKPTLSHLIRSLSKKAHLRDLHISVGPAEFCRYTDKMLSDRFVSLKRLVLQSWAELDFVRCRSTPADLQFQHLPHFPLLESVHIEGGYNAAFEPPPPSVFPESVASTTVYPEFATRIWRSPNLRIINRCPTLIHTAKGDVFSLLDNIESAGEITGLIRSLRHGDGEVIHARLFLRHTEHSDTLLTTAAISYYHIRVPYTSRDGVRRQKLFEACHTDEGAWYDFLEYDGYAVPLSVVQKMRRAQGASAKDWEGRGVQIGARAWNELLSWRDAQPGSEKRMPSREKRGNPDSGIEVE